MKNHSGQSLVEYVLILALVAVIVIVTLTALRRHGTRAPLCANCLAPIAQDPPDRADGRGER
jgi:hypothetical protein